MIHYLNIRQLTVPMLFVTSAVMGQLYTPTPTISGTDVRIGNTTQIFGAKLSVTGAADPLDDYTVVIRTNTSNGSNLGLTSYVSTDNAASTGVNYGLWSQCGNAMLSTHACGVRALAENGTGGGYLGTLGLWATANSNATGSGGRTIGVKAEASLGNTGVSSWVDGMTTLTTLENGATGSVVFGAENDVKLNAGSTTNGAYSVSGTLSGPGSITSEGYGLRGVISGGSAPMAYGCSGSVSSASTKAYGVYGIATAGPTRYGAYGEATNAGTFTSLYGVFGKAPMVQSVPISNWGAVTSWAGYFDGHVQVVGSFTSGSDRKLKKDIAPLEGALGILGRLSPKTYYFDAEKYPTMSLPREHQFGLIAQEVQKVVPELVLRATHPEQIDSTGKVLSPAVDYLTMNYQGLIPVLIGGIQEQQAQLAAQQEEIDRLKDRLAGLEKMLEPATTGDSGEHMDALFQNEPNPFGENTVIRYVLGNMSGKASIDLIGVNGQVVKRFTALGAGNGQVLITAGSLPAGTYTYVLSVDGKQVDAKQMVITH